MTPPVLHHVGIVVPDADEMAAMMATLGLTEDYRGYVPEFHALCVFTHGNGASPVEFVIPDGGPLLKFNKGMGGLHHLAYLTDSLDLKAAELEAQGAKFLEAEHVKGAGPFRCNFVSPIYTRGLTIEYIELL
ncbi:MAG: VOC family protein [Sphingomonadaceae bacterium]|nr:VOC family protein [Sphingomonadaceae bacterium]